MKLITLALIIATAGCAPEETGVEFEVGESSSALSSTLLGFGGGAIEQSVVLGEPDIHALLRVEIRAPQTSLQSFRVAVLQPDVSCVTSTCSNRFDYFATPFETEQTVWQFLTDRDVQFIRRDDGVLVLLKPEET